MPENQSDRSEKASPQRRGFSQQKWRHVYYGLALFNLLAISISLGINHHLAGLYSDSLVINSLWLDRLEAVSKMGDTASTANVAGNDVFENNRIDHQEAIFIAEAEQFHLLLASFETEMGLTFDGETEHRVDFVDSIAETRRSMLAMERTAQYIFQMSR